MTVDADGVVTGNTYDKYGSTNPLVRRLMAGFETAVDGLLAQAAPATILDVGCGEGVVAERWARLRPSTEILGIDLEDATLAQAWAQIAVPNLRFDVMRAEALAFDAGAFDLVSAIEVLEHLPDPDTSLAELVRVARGHVLVSVPREPLWRMLNVARGAYVRDLGNTPGHLNHWSRRSLVRMLARHGEVVAVRSPFPWTVALLRVG